LPEERERQGSTGESPALLKATGVCVQLDYSHVKITGKNDVINFSGEI